MFLSSSCIIIAVFGCRASTPTYVNDPPVGQLDTSWWNLGEQSCPRETTLHGASPPIGTEVWCQTEDGYKKGPYTAWHSNGVKSSDGQYRGHAFKDSVLWLNGTRRGKDGQMHTWETKGGTTSTRYALRDGTWRFWDSDGTPLRAEKYTDGKLVGLYRVPRG